MPPLIVSHSLRVAATPDRVWGALTDPAELIQWYAPGCRWQIEALAAGAGVRFFNTETDVQAATIDTIVPHSRFALRWTPDPALPVATLLTAYALEPTPDGTIVTLTHTGYESVPAESRAEWLAADQGAVPAIVAALGGYLRS